MIRFRPVKEEDAGLLFDWANEALVREMSIRQEPIVWEDHISWIKKQLVNDDIRMFLLEEDGMPVGQLRLEKKEGVWMIGYSVDADHRGKGYGKKLIMHAFDNIESGSIVALVKPANQTSVKIFSDLGFSDKGQIEENGVLLTRFEYIKHNMV